MLETDGGGNVTATNTFGPNGLLSRAAGGAGTFYAFDELGNVAQRLDGGGNVQSSDLYGAYGRRASGNPGGDPFGFGGQAGYYTDAETGLCLLGQREYDPQAGRFLTRDPAGYAGGQNLYGYTDDDPANEMDPSGLDPTDDLSNPDNTNDNNPAFQSELSFRDPGMVQAGLDASSNLARQAPGVGAAIGVIGAFTGCDVITGRNESGGQRAWDGAGTLMAVAPVLGTMRFPAWNATKKLTMFLSAFKHWYEHRSEFPELSRFMDYVNKAHDIINNPADGTMIKGVGDWLHYYVPSENTYVAAFKGSPATMLRPKEGIVYFLRQETPQTRGWPGNTSWYTMNR